MRGARSLFPSWLVLLLIVSHAWVASVQAATSQDVAAGDISNAEQSLSQAFVAVLDAEKAGANVSGLLNRLNDGADLLSQSRVAFDDGSFDEAARLANSSTGVSGEVWDEAARFSVEASDAAVDRGWLFLAVSIVAVSIALVASIFGYRYFKRYYYRRLLRMKPRVGKA